MTNQITMKVKFNPDEFHRDHPEEEDPEDEDESESGRDLKQRMKFEISKL